MSMRKQMEEVADDILKRGNGTGDITLMLLDKLINASHNFLSGEIDQDTFSKNLKEVEGAISGLHREGEPNWPRIENDKYVE